MSETFSSLWWTFVLFFWMHLRNFENRLAALTRIRKGSKSEHTENSRLQKLLTVQKVCSIYIRFNWESFQPVEMPKKSAFFCSSFQKKPLQLSVPVSANAGHMSLKFPQVFHFLGSASPQVVVERETWRNCAQSGQSNHGKLCDMWCVHFAASQLSWPASTVGTALWSSLPNRNRSAALWKHHNVRRFCPEEKSIWLCTRIICFICPTYFSGVKWFFIWNLISIPSWKANTSPSYFWKMILHPRNWNMWKMMIGRLVSS